MNKQMSLYYLEWDDTQGVVGEIHERTVGTDELFQSKLVNATVIHNGIWEHSSHETNELGEGIIYLKPWFQSNVEHGKDIQTIIFSQFEVSNKAGIEFFVLDGEKYSKLCSENYDQSLHIAQILLDHYRYIQGQYYSLTYAILDVSRNKTLIFLEAGE